MSEKRIVAMIIECGYPETAQIFENMVDEANKLGDTHVQVLVNTLMSENEDASTD